MTLSEKDCASRRRAAVLVAGSIVTYVAAQSAEPKEKVIKITAKAIRLHTGNLTLKKGEPVILNSRPSTC